MIPVLIERTRMINPTVLKEKIRKPMCIKIGQESSVGKDKMTFPIFIQIGNNHWKAEVRIPMCIKIGSEFQRLEG